MDAPSDKDKELLSAIDQLLNDAHTEIEVFRRQPKCFNVFDIVGVEHYETTHSSILAGILAYGGDNYAPLRSFLKICSQSINLDNLDSRAHITRMMSFPSVYPEKPQE